LYIAFSAFYYNLGLENMNDIRKISTETK